MNCPRCGLPIEDTLTTTCPRCGQALAGTAAQSLPGSEVVSGAFYEAPTLASAGPPAAGAGSVPGERYDFPPYGPGALSSPSMSGQSVLSGAPPSVPSGINAPLAPAPAMPPRKSKSGLIIGILIALVVLLVSGLGVSLYALAHKQPSASIQATATLAPTVAPTATPTILFQDPLTSNTNGWANDSHCFFQNGAYHVKDGYLCFAPAGVIPDGTISVDAQQVAGPPGWFYGINFRHVSQGNYYVFVIDSYGEWKFSKVVNDTLTDILPYRPDEAIKRGLNTINTLLVQAKGSHFEFYVNGIQVGQDDDSTFASGRCGVIGGGGGIEVSFNNFKITASS